MPESLTRKTTLAEATCGWPASARNGGRLQIGMAAGFMSEWVAGFASEPWPASIGMTGRHHSESAIRRVPRTHPLVWRGKGPNPGEGPSMLGSHGRSLLLGAYESPRGQMFRSQLIRMD